MLLTIYITTNHQNFIWKHKRRNNYRCLNPKKNFKKWKTSLPPVERFLLAAAANRRCDATRRCRRRCRCRCHCRWRLLSGPGCAPRPSVASTEAPPHSDSSSTKWTERQEFPRSPTIHAYSYSIMHIHDIVTKNGHNIINNNTNNIHNISNMIVVIIITTSLIIIFITSGLCYKLWLSGTFPK